ncbi:hypothetical protein FP435_04690 [Lactobacillus sp. PV037]|uniref:hypothetical protein n=1 Tax=Lactobacillus sp. PV037 TaxID=2594496 RepID=UPI00223F786B|nr:hypothetical protein [Lactobacillus sp. PV037]QNQ83789.1 hypothetical protein FP435_04690 [Lactobacillus sp. PV037]
MEVVFKEEDKNFKKKIGYGTILMCEDHIPDKKFDLYRVSATKDSDGNFELDILHEEDDIEEIGWDIIYPSISEMIANLKRNYDSVKVVDAHIVVDRVSGEV